MRWTHDKRSMPEKTTQMRLYVKDLDRIKNYGRAGDPLADALSKALDLADAYKKEHHDDY